MYGGISYTIHAGAPVGQRVSDIKVGASPLEDKNVYHMCEQLSCSWRRRL